MTAAYALLLAVRLSAAPAETPSAESTQGSQTPLATATASAPALEPAKEPWMEDNIVTRPRSLQVLYGTLGALQALDVYSTRRAINGGATEINPVMKKTAGSQTTMLVAKALSTASSIYFAERAWKKNRKGAVVLMAAVNAVTAAVVARNLRTAR